MEKKRLHNENFPGQEKDPDNTSTFEKENDQGSFNSPVKRKKQFESPRADQPIPKHVLEEMDASKKYAAAKFSEFALEEMLKNAVLLRRTLQEMAGVKSDSPKVSSEDSSRDALEKIIDELRYFNKVEGWLDEIDDDGNLDAVPGTPQVNNLYREREPELRRTPESAKDYILALATPDPINDDPTPLLKRNIQINGNESNSGDKEKKQSAKKRLEFFGGDTSQTTPKDLIAMIDEVTRRFETILTQENLAIEKLLQGHRLQVTDQYTKQMSLGALYELRALARGTAESLASLKQEQKNIPIVLDNNNIAMVKSLFDQIEKDCARAVEFQQKVSGTVIEYRKDLCKVMTFFNVKGRVGVDRAESKSAECYATVGGSEYKEELADAAVCRRLTKAVANLLRNREDNFLTPDPEETRVAMKACIEEELAALGNENNDNVGRPNFIIAH